MPLPNITQSKKKNIIWDATVLTALMACPCLVDLRYNHHFQSLKGKSNSLECGSIVHKILEVFYRELIKGYDRKQAIISGMAAGLMYIQGCRHCTDFESYDCEKCNGDGTFDAMDKCATCNGTGEITKPPLWTPHR